MTKRLTLLLFIGLVWGGDISYQSGQNIPNNTFGGFFFGFGGGAGNGGTHIDLGIFGSQNFNNEFKKVELYFIFGTTLNIDAKIYDFSKDLFEDPIVDEKSEYTYFAIGPTIRLNADNMMHFGLGSSRKLDYWELYDSSQLLSGNGRYFVINDESDTRRLNLSIGYSGKLSNNSALRYLGFYINLFPLNLTAMIWMG